MPDIGNGSYKADGEWKEEKQDMLFQSILYYRLAQ